MAAISIAPFKQEMVEPLENGDNLDAVEFMRRYEPWPEDKKAELIEGIVYLGSAVREVHGFSHSLLQVWLGIYAIRTPGTQAASRPTVRLNPENIPQPDALLRIIPEYGGQMIIDEEGFLQGTPELIAEIATSSAALELHQKLRAYCRAGVREYLVWCPIERQFDWFVLAKKEFRPNAPASPGVLRSPHFPGLALAVEALLNDDWPKVLDVLQTSLQDPAHGAFVAKLAAKARK
jgi:hypothetical protein